MSRTTKGSKGNKEFWTARPGNKQGSSPGSAYQSHTSIRYNLTMTTKPVIHTSPGIIGEDSIRIDTVENCARCGETHLFLTFRKLKNKAGKATHWCLCPTTHEPIMMHLAPEKKSRKK